MVTRLITYRWLGLLWCLLTPLSVAGEYTLWLTLPNNAADQPVTTELGRPLTVLLWYQGPADLDRINTAPWQSDFAIDQGYAKRVDNTQQLRFRLTPRRSGALSLPPLRLGGAQSQTLLLQVKPALESGELLEPHWSISETQPWQRQELRAELWLDMAATDSRLTLNLFQPAGFTVHSLPVSDVPQADGRRRYHYRWLLRPQQTGPQTLAAPILRTVHDGVPQRRFYFPDTALTVQPLPAYVPPTIPVGQLQGGAAGKPVFATGITAKDLVSSLQRAGLPATAVQTANEPNGTRSEARIDWSRAKPTEAGVVYFDPLVGRLRRLAPQPHRPYAFAITGLLTAITLALLWWQGQRLWRYWRFRRYRHRLRRALAKAEGADTVAMALLAFPLPGASQPPRTLQLWYTAYRQHDPTRAEALRTWLERLDQARYAAHGWPMDGNAQINRIL